MYLKACVNDSVLLISNEYISDPDNIVKGQSSPKEHARAWANAVLPMRNMMILWNKYDEYDDLWYKYDEYDDLWYKYDGYDDFMI